jgi:quinoprotein glucose dehydrogenase
MTAPSRRSLLLSTAAILASSATSLPVRAQGQVAAPNQGKPGDVEWHYYGGDAANRRYSPLDQINAANFNKLEVAWRFKPDALGARPEYQFEATPLMIGGRIFTTAGSRRDVVALDARTGEMLWLHRYDEGERGRLAPRQLSGRGLSYWTDGKEERIVFVTPGYRLIALDARTGDRIQGFGSDGVVDLRLDDDQDMDLDRSDIGLHSTPIISQDVVIVGAAHDSGNVPPSHVNVKGYVRGFDVRTGKRIWIFHTIPVKGEFGYDSWLVPGQAEKAGNAGVWAQTSVDEELGLVYLPVESPTGDYNGQYRHGNGLFGESIVAVEIKTGKRRWHYQLVHHGIWDRDIPCAPILVDIPVNGKIVKALAQPTKQAFLYVLDRTNGKPIWPIPEVKVEKGNVPGEWYAPTQPIPSKPPGYDVQGVKMDDLIDFTPELRAEAVKLVSNWKIGPLFTPPVLSTDDGPLGTLVAPGINGGTNWPGGCYDPETYTVYVYSQTGVGSIGLIKNPGQDVSHSDFDYLRGVYGSVPRQAPPSGSSAREEAQQGGGGRRAQAAPQAAQPSATLRRSAALTVQGLPLLKPPYGRITALDLAKGAIAWQVAHGETPDNIRNHPALKGLKIPRTGRPGILGPTVTKSLVICGESGVFTTPSGARGAMLRAYDKKTGAEQGAIYMPAGQTGSPMTYMLDGRQYLVVAIGGGNYTAELLAFRLPRA